MKRHTVGRVVCCALLVFSLAAAFAQTVTAGAPPPAVVSGFSFRSVALGRSMPYQVLLPIGYDNSVERYPVLYLLHGWNGDETNYIKLTKLAADAAMYKLIIVMPRGENSWYVDSAKVPGDRFAEYIAHDLVADVDARFRTVASPRARAIAGLSMGGYGALLLAMQHPGGFAFVGSLSGAFDAPSGIEAVMPSLKQSIDVAFGAQDSDARRGDDLRTLLATASPATQPSFFLACGASDPLLESNRSIVRLMSARGFVYEYHELPGAHTWPFWSQELAPMLDALGRAMHVGRTSSSPSSSGAPSQTP